MKKQAGTIICSPSDPIRYLASPFASWLDRCHLDDGGFAGFADFLILDSTGRVHCGIAGGISSGRNG